MLHVVPILCLIAFIGVVEIRLRNDFKEIEEDFQATRGLILENTKKIKELETKLKSLNG